MNKTQRIDDVISIGARHGKITIRGAFVESHATGTNRIKDAAVKVN